MSQEVYCPECGEFDGETSLAPRGTRTCSSCGEEYDLVEATGGPHEPWIPSGVENPEEGDRVRSINGEGVITGVWEADGEISVLFVTDDDEDVFEQASSIERVE